VLCNQQGCPVAVEVFAGNTADPSTLKSQIDRLKQVLEQRGQRWIAVAAA
jgi:transposase